jgi:hypothetical protein
MMFYCINGEAVQFVLREELGRRAYRASLDIARQFLGKVVRYGGNFLTCGVAGDWQQD